MIEFLEKTPKLLVIGDLMIDEYLWGSCNRISPEAPVQVVNIEKKSEVLGGAGNVVNNLKKLGAEVDIISVIGDCQNSIKVKSLLSDINVETKYLIKQKNRLSSKKTRIIASQQQVVRFDQESSDDINQESENKVIQIFNQLIQNYELVLLSDYGKGVLTNKTTQSLIQTAKKNSVKVIVDPKGSNYLKYHGAYSLTPNQKEASKATNVDIFNQTTLNEAIIKLKSLCNLEVSIITLSEDGIAVFDDNLRLHSTVVKEVFDVTGAGDTVLASLGYALACGIEIDQAIKFSNLAASVVVGKIGSATASLSEIRAYESSINKSSSDNLIKSFEEISNLVKELKEKNKKIVFTNGCYDLIHVGHISFLETAKTYGDILIVGLNSDQSVKKLKGNNRPINSQSDRAKILASLEVVDYLVIFDEDTPYKLIKELKPHTLVKGGDYEGQKVVGQDIADELKIVKFVEGKSSTQTINKIINMN